MCEGYHGKRGSHSWRKTVLVRTEEIPRERFAGLIEAVTALE